MGMSKVEAFIADGERQEREAARKIPLAIAEFCRWVREKGNKLADQKWTGAYRTRAEKCLKIVLGRKPTDTEIDALVGD
jgi:hypothetical protein